MNTHSSQDLRIVSLLPSATEMVAELGLVGRLFAVSHACDFPPEVANLPVITKSIVPPDLTSEQIDAFVAKAVRDGRSLYTVDEELLQEIAPDVVITQALCDVCAVNYETVARSLGRLQKQPKLVSLNPGCIEEIFADLMRVASALKRQGAAARIVDEGRRRLGRLKDQTAGLSRPRVLTLEWYEPPFFGGHWVPEQVELAGGESVVGAAHCRSERISWEKIEQLDPDVILLMPCGYNLQQTLELGSELREKPHWERLRAVREGRVVAVDANACFSRPSLRVVQGAEVVGHILHPETVPAPSCDDLFDPFPSGAK